MVKIGWKSLTESGPRPNGRACVVAAPVAHQGIRSALRSVFDNDRSLPAEWRALLARLD